MKKVGIVIADTSEFAPLARIAEKYNAEIYEKYGDRYLKFTINKGEKSIEVVAVCCGIGKVNAAMAATVLCVSEKVDMIINFGLSGAIKGLNKNDIVIGTKFFEHDFDLTPLGYKIGEKPQEISSYTADEQLLKLFTSVYPNIKRCVFVTGDMFVSDSKKKELIINSFNGGCCDMETAAIASVCYKSSVPFVSIRSISDDADESAGDSYREANTLEEDVLAKITLLAIVQYMN